MTDTHAPFSDLSDALDEQALYSLVRRESRDADEQAACLRDWDQIYEQLSPGEFEGRFMEVWFRGIQLFREVANQSMHEAGTMRAGDRVLGVPVAMEGQGYFCGRPIAPDAIMTMRGGDEMDFRAPKHFDIVAVSIPIDILTRYAKEIEHRDIEQELQHVAVVQASKAAVNEFRGFLLTALESVSRTPAMLQYPAMQKGLEHALLSSVVKAVDRSTNEAARSTASPTARHAIVSRAQEYMRTHVEEPLTVEDLCRVLGVSRRTLQYSFQEVLQLNPVSYLRAIRLNGARRMLKSADPQRHSVQDIAARWGFWHLSHFANDYRRMFGELPSETLRNTTYPAQQV
ncbi:MAG: helix-turn-helix domain-containing protein [Zoogloeaceae bacterium]|jgi:AraC family ethanolamine operon transcriptional activator|nr:helix-turn-helix domain-containing protein [Zoogloeaceae bacterium]